VAEAEAAALPEVLGVDVAPDVGVALGRPPASPTASTTASPTAICDPASGTVAITIPSGLVTDPGAKAVRNPGEFAGEPRIPALCDRELVPQDQNLDILGRRPARGEPGPSEHPRHPEVDQLQCHSRASSQLAGVIGTECPEREGEADVGQLITAMLHGR
jgi:hypothetical protein